jgi:hypothetical protein
MMKNNFSCVSYLFTLFYKLNVKMRLENHPSSDSFCIQAFRDPDNLNRSDSSLVERLSPDQEDMNLCPIGRTEPGKLTKSGRPWSSTLVNQL